MPFSHRKRSLVICKLGFESEVVHARIRCQVAGLFVQSGENKGRECA